MKLAFWRRQDDAEPLLEVQAWLSALPADPQPRLVALPPGRVQEKLEDAIVEKVGELHDVKAKLDEVTVERDELLAALDERRPAPDPEELGRQLQAAWFATEGGQRGFRERWTAVAETAIDAVRGLWPSPAAAGERAAGDGEHLTAADVAVLDLEAERRLHDPQRCNRYPFCTCPTKTSPGATGQRPPVAAPGRLGSPYAPGDTTSSTATAAEPLDPAEGSPAETSTEEAAAPTSAGPPPTRAQIAAIAEQLLEQLAERLAIAAGTVEPGTWHLMPRAYHRVYRRLADEVALVGWRPPGTGRLAGNHAVLAGVLTDHELLVDGTCRCGYGVGWGEPPAKVPPFELWHAEHLASELLTVGVA